MANTTIIFTPFWYPKESDGSECYLCKEVIYSDRWILTLSYSKTKIRETKMQVCTSCYEALINE